MPTLPNDEVPWPPCPRPLEMGPVACPEPPELQAGVVSCAPRAYRCSAPVLLREGAAPAVAPRGAVPSLPPPAPAVLCPCVRCRCAPLRPSAVCRSWSRAACCAGLTVFSCPSGDGAAPLPLLGTQPLARQLSRVSRSLFPCGFGHGFGIILLFYQISCHLSPLYQPWAFHRPAPVPAPALPFPIPFPSPPVSGTLSILPLRRGCGHGSNGTLATLSP